MSVPFKITLYFVAFWLGILAAAFFDSPSVLFFVCLGLGASLLLPEVAAPPANDRKGSGLDGVSPDQLGERLEMSKAIRRVK